MLTIRTDKYNMRVGDKFIHHLKTPYTVVGTDGEWLVCTHKKSNPRGTHRFLMKEFNRVVHSLNDVLRI